MTELLILRVVHILGGIFWVGSGLFSAIFLTPAMIAAGPAAGQVMAGLQQRRLFTVLPVAALLTIASGGRLMAIMSGGFASAYFATRTGQALSIAGGASVVGFLLAMFVARPSSVAAVALSSNIASATSDAARAEMQTRINALRARAAMSSTVVLVLLVISAIGMAVARYL